MNARLVIAGLLLLSVAATRREDSALETGTAYNKVEDTTTVFARMFFRKSTGTLDSLTASYTFAGKKQSAYVKPQWNLSLYARPNADKFPQTVRILINDKGPALRLECRFVDHDDVFGGDRYVAELTDDLEKALLDARTLEFIPPSVPMALSQKLDAAETNKLKAFFRSAAATNKPSK
jgi:hypothetical protein